MAERKTVKRQVKNAQEKAPKTEKKDGLSAPVLDIDGKNVGTIELSKEVFGLKPNKVLMAQAVRVYLANQRLGNAATKTKGEVRGGGRKPWRQKGTGRARAGSIRSPLWRGGGVTHGPQPRDFSLDLPKKMKRKALASALSDKVLEKGLTVLNEIEFKAPKTKEAVTMLKNLNATEKTLVSVPTFSEKEIKAFRNLKEVKMLQAVDLNTYEVLNSKRLLITKKAVEALEKLLTSKEKVS